VRKRLGKAKKMLRRIKKTTDPSKQTTSKISTTIKLITATRFKKVVKGVRSVPSGIPGLWQAIKPKDDGPKTTATTNSAENTGLKKMVKTFTRSIPLFVAVLGRQGPIIQSRIKTQSESI
jgi:hypothetical protein